MKRFKRIYVEITNICNLSCSFCPSTMRAPEFISPAFFTKILDDIRPFTDYIYLHIKGEPFMHPQIGLLLDIAYEKGLKVNITTNGTIPVGDLISKSALRQINFSLHSNENLSNNSAKEYLENILETAKNGVDKNNIFIALRLWNLDKDNNINESLNKNRETLGCIEQFFSLDYQIKEKVTAGKGVKVYKNIFVNYEPEFVWPSLADSYSNENGYCYALKHQAGILVDGTVVPCCLDGEGIINLGSLKELPFKEIINSDRALSIYNSFTNRKAVELLCKKCRFKGKFD